VEDRELRLWSGWGALAVALAWLGGIVALIALAFQWHEPQMLWAIIPLSLLWLFFCGGFIVNNPNQTRVVQLFGKYVGTLHAVGFFWGNPLYATELVSLRVQVFETGMSKMTETKDAAGRVIVAGSAHREPVKVNDRDGTPIEIAAVVVWKVVNPADAVF
jgi:regulator of protease activity HflC (stomatin/prohibitin superfamily)